MLCAFRRYCSNRLAMLQTGERARATGRTPFPLDAPVLNCSAHVPGHLTRTPGRSTPVALCSYSLRILRRRHRERFASRRSRHLARSETTACSRCGPTGPPGSRPVRGAAPRTSSALPSRPRHPTLTAPSLACGITRLFHGIPIVKSGLRSGYAGCADARKNRCAAGTRLDFITPTCSQPLRPF
jgi:hypothetical protein